MYPLEFKCFEYSLHKLNILEIKIFFAECILWFIGGLLHSIIWTLWRE